MLTPAPLPVRAGEFEGPLDLLLALVQHNKVNLDTVPIADITRQYLEYLRRAESSRVELDSDFILMAATLIHIKSRMLLPADPALARAAEDDPRRQLIERLRQHAIAKEIAQTLKSRMEVEEETWFNPGIRHIHVPPDIETGPASRATGKASLADLLDTLQSAVARAKAQVRLVVEQDEVTPEERMEWFRVRTGMGGARRLGFWELAAEQRDLRSAACLFLALLELARNGEVALEQSGEELMVEVLGAA